MATARVSASDHGVKPMVVAAAPSGSNGSIQENNTAMTQQTTQRQLAARFGGSRKVLKGGLVVPPVRMNYPESGTGNTSTGNNITASAKTTADLSASAEFDKQVGPVQKAGRRKKLVGGWPEWGCMSGGRKRRKSRKSRKLRSRKLRSRKLKSRKRNSYRRRKSK
jgi:hypothetical protein